MQLNTTCDACIRNCTQSAAVNATLINTLEKCTGPIYNVVNTIANHSKKLMKTIENLQDVVSESKNAMETASNLEVNDLCSCNM